MDISTSTYFFETFDKGMYSCKSEHEKLVLLKTENNKSSSHCHMNPLLFSMNFQKKLNNQKCICNTNMRLKRKKNVKICCVVYFKHRDIYT